MHQYLAENILNVRFGLRKQKDQRNKSYFLNENNR